MHFQEDVIDAKHPTHTHTHGKLVLEGFGVGGSNELLSEWPEELKRPLPSAAINVLMNPECA